MYNPIPDLLIFGVVIAAIAGMIYYGSRTPKPYPRYFMIDQAKRWGHK